MQAVVQRLRGLSPQKKALWRAQAREAYPGEGYMGDAYSSGIDSEVSDNELRGRQWRLGRRLGRRGERGGRGEGVREGEGEEGRGGRLSEECIIFSAVFVCVLVSE